MEKFIELAKKRGSCRNFTDKPVDKELLLSCVEAASMAPSACNSQPWKFIVVDSPEAKEKLCDAIVTDEGTTGAPWRRQVAAFIILVEQQAKIMPAVEKHYHTTQRFAQGDIGAACMNMCHEAFSLGLGTCIIGVNEQSKMEKHFGIPHGHEVRLVLAVGYAADATPAVKIRKPLEEVCCFNFWQ